MKHRIVPMAIVLLELGASQVKAQTAEPATESKTTEKAEEKKPADKKSERIEVTGSRIRRIDVETSAPVQVITRKEIEQSGVSSLGDVFRKSASSSPTGNFAGSSGYVVQGASTIDLLGLGGSRTLVLLNGKRLPALGGLDSVNIDNIPIGIIDRIDILSGGASAVYGADAVGGVVNIITRKEFTGSEISMYKSFTTHKGGEEAEITAVQGIGLGDSGNAILSAGYRERKRIDKRDRDLKYSNPELAYTVSQQPAGSWTYRPVDINPDGSLNPGNYVPSANCPMPIATNPDDPDNVLCAGERKNAFLELIPQKQDWFVAATANYTLPSEWNLSGIISFSRSINEDKDGKFLPYAVNPLTNEYLKLSTATAHSLGLVPTTESADYFEFYAPLPEFPDRTYINTYDTFASGVYLDGNVGEWKTSGGLAYAQSKSKREGKKIFNSEMMGKLFDGVDPIYNPLDPNRDVSLLDETFVDLKSTMQNSSTAADVFFSKDLMDLPGGKFALGIGGSVSFESFKMNPDARDIEQNSKYDALYTGTFADRGDGDRNVTSVYAEFVAPVVKDVNVEGALRFDHYSDFDSTANFGLGVKASITSWLGIRGRAASSFTAPTLASLHQIGGGGYLSVYDEKWCDRENDAGRTCEYPVRQVYVDSPGNKDLEPEIGLNYIAGLILDPIPGLSLVSDYYWINLKKTFHTDDVQQVVDAWYENNPNATTGGDVKGDTVQVDSEGVITRVGLPIRNLGKLEVRAIDTKLAYSLPLGAVRLGYDSQYFRMMSYKIQEIQDSPLRQQVTYTGIPAWRWNNRLTAALKSQDFSLSARTIAPQKVDPLYYNGYNEETKVAVYTEYDFVYGVELPWNGSLQLGVNDIFDTIGGKYDGNRLRSQDIATDSLYSYIGRAYYARLTQRF